MATGTDVQIGLEFQADTSQTQKNLALVSDQFQDLSKTVEEVSATFDDFSKQVDAGLANLPVEAEAITAAWAGLNDSLGTAVGTTLPYVKDLNEAVTTVAGVTDQFATATEGVAAALKDSYPQLKVVADASRGVADAVESMSTFLGTSETALQNFASTSESAQAALAQLDFVTPEQALEQFGTATDETSTKTEQDTQVMVDSWAGVKEGVSDSIQTVLPYLQSFSEVSENAAKTMGSVGSALTLLALATGGTAIPLDALAAGADTVAVVLAGLTVASQATEKGVAALDTVCQTSQTSLNDLANTPAGDALTAAALAIGELAAAAQDASPAIAQLVSAEDQAYWEGLAAGIKSASDGLTDLTTAETDALAPLDPTVAASFWDGYSTGVTQADTAVAQFTTSADEASTSIEKLASPDAQQAIDGLATSVEQAGTALQDLSSDQVVKGMEELGTSAKDAGDSMGEFSTSIESSATAIQDLDLDKSKTSLAEFGTSAEEAKTSVTGFAEAVDTSEGSLSALSVDKSATELSELSKSSGEADTSLTSISSTVGELEQSLTGLSVKEIDDSLKTMDETVSAVDVEFTVVSETITGLVTAFDEFSTSVTSAEEALTALIVVDVSKDLTQTNDTSEALDTTLTDLSDTVQTLDSDFTQLSTQFTTGADLVDQFQTAIVEASAGLKELQLASTSTATAMQSQLEILNKQIAALQENITALETYSAKQKDVQANVQAAQAPGRDWLAWWKDSATAIYMTVGAYKVIGDLWGSSKKEADDSAKATKNAADATSGLSASMAGLIPVMASAGTAVTGFASAISDSMGKAIDKYKEAATTIETTKIDSQPLKDYDTEVKELAISITAFGDTVKTQMRDSVVGSLNEMNASFKGTTVSTAAIERITAGMTDYTANIARLDTAQKAFTESSKTEGLTLEQLRDSYKASFGEDIPKYVTQAYQVMTGEIKKFIPVVDEHVKSQKKLEETFNTTKGAVLVAAESFVSYKNDVVDSISFLKPEVTKFDVLMQSLFSPPSNIKSFDDQVQFIKASFDNLGISLQQTAAEYGVMAATAIPALVEVQKTQSTVTKEATLSGEAYTVAIEKFVGLREAVEPLNAAIVGGTIGAFKGLADQVHLAGEKLGVVRQEANSFTDVTVKLTESQKEWVKAAIDSGMEADKLAENYKTTFGAVAKVPDNVKKAWDDGWKAIHIKFAEDMALNGTTLIDFESEYVMKFGQDVPDDISKAFGQVGTIVQGSLSNLVKDIEPVIPLKERLAQAGNISLEEGHKYLDWYNKDLEGQKNLYDALAPSIGAATEEQVKASKAQLDAATTAGQSKEELAKLQAAYNGLVKSAADGAKTLEDAVKKHNDSVKGEETSLKAFAQSVSSVLWTTQADVMKLVATQMSGNAQIEADMGKLSAKMVDEQKKFDDLAKQAV